MDTNIDKDAAYDPELENGEEMPPLLNENEIRLLSSYYSTLTLTGEQRDQIAAKFVECTSTEERRTIALVYPQLFKDHVFVQRLKLRIDASLRPETQTTREIRQGKRIRNSIDEQLPKLTGDGPYTIEFGLASAEPERQEVLEVYASQFTHPEPHEMTKMVCLPRSQSTRTRKQITGSLTWFVRCVSMNEIVCCVTAVVHRREGGTCFVEVPLFATRSGYKGRGFARLLNAAMLEFCLDHVKGCKFVMVSADKKAVPFWSHLGYTAISKADKASIEFDYEHYCYHFTESEQLTMSLNEIEKRRRTAHRVAVADAQMADKVHDEGEVGDGNRSVPSVPELVGSLVLETLQRMKIFVLRGPSRLLTVD